MYKAITMDNSNCWQVLTLVVISLANSQIGYNDLLLIQTKLIILDFPDVLKPMSFPDVSPYSIYWTYKRCFIRKLNVLTVMMPT